MCCVGTRTSFNRHATCAHTHKHITIDSIGILSKQNILSMARNRGTKRTSWVPSNAMNASQSCDARLGLRSWHKVIFKLPIEPSILTKKLHGRHRWRNLSRAHIEVHPWSSSPLNGYVFMCESLDWIGKILWPRPIEKSDNISSFAFGSRN